MSSLGSSQLDEVQLDPLTEATVARAQPGLRTLGLKSERNQHGVRSSLREWSPMWNIAASLRSINLQVFRKQGDGQAIWKLITVTVGWVLSKAHLGFPGGLVSKESACSAGSQETLVLSLGWEDPLEKWMQPTPVFLPGEPHGQGSLAGYSPWGCKESDMTEAT